MICRTDSWYQGELLSLSSPRHDHRRTIFTSQDSKCPWIILPNGQHRFHIPTRLFGPTSNTKVPSVACGENHIPSFRPPEQSMLGV